MAVPVVPPAVCSAVVLIAPTTHYNIITFVFTFPRGFPYSEIEDA